MTINLDLTNRPFHRLPKPRVPKYSLPEDRSETGQEHVADTSNAEPQLVQPPVEDTLETRRGRLEEETPSPGAAEAAPAGEIKTRPKLSQNKAQTRLKLGQQEARTEPKLGHQNGNTAIELNPNKAQTRPYLGQNKAKTEPKLGQQEAREAILELPHLQRRVLDIAFASAVEMGAKRTGPISADKVAPIIGSTLLAVRKAFQRVEGRGLLVRSRFKRGRSGWTVYEIPDGVHLAMWNEARGETRPKLGPNEAWTGPETRPETRPTGSSSGSFTNKIKENNTTTTAPTQGLPTEWEEVDLSPLQDLGLAIGRSHLVQFHRWGGIDPRTVQDSVLAFAFDIEVNSRHKDVQTDPLRFFMGCLRREGAYLPPQNYASPRRRVLEEYQARKRAEEERVAELDRVAVPETRGE